MNRLKFWVVDGSLLLVGCGQMYTPKRRRVGSEVEGLRHTVLTGATSTGQQTDARRSGSQIRKQPRLYSTSHGGCHALSASNCSSEEQPENDADALVHITMESLRYLGSMPGHKGWVTAIATSSENPDMILTASRGM